ncbi:hypothetical protein X975_08696, partial [Stegodyphus mimosarum]
MPHRPVSRDDKFTTKERMVFDASSKENQFKSLNDCLWPGPNLNTNILDIIINFRNHEVAICADLEKAFLQIGLTPEDQNYLKFLWFDDKAVDLFKILRFTRVPFGATCSPFILAATIKCHIQKYKKEHCKVYGMLNTSLYVDDLISGSNSEEEAYYLYSTAAKILKDTGMHLRKFNSNSMKLREMWKGNMLCSEQENSDLHLKDLGILWNTDSDTFQLDAQPLIDNLERIKSTKRCVLKTMLKYYIDGIRDPEIHGRCEGYKKRSNVGHEIRGIQQATRRDHHAVRAMRVHEPADQLMARLDDLCRQVSTFGRYINDGKPTVKCWNCGTLGHMRRKYKFSLDFKNNKLLSSCEDMSIDKQKGSSAERSCSESCRNPTRVEEEHEATDYSPSQMLIGRDLRLPCDLLSGRPADAPSLPEKYIQVVQARFKVMHRSARERINLATEKMKTRYDTRATGLLAIVSTKEIRCDCEIRLDGINCVRNYSHLRMVRTQS